MSNHRVEELVLAYEILTDDDLGLCCYETLESRRGACDGGERCLRKAVWIIEGVRYCERHPSREAATLGILHYRRDHEAFLDRANQLADEIHMHSLGEA